MRPPLASLLLLAGCNLGLDALAPAVGDSGAPWPGFESAGVGGSDGADGADGSDGSDGNDGSDGSDGEEPPVDADGDGADSRVDCNDADPDAYPGAAYAESDSACMRDADGDGYGDQNAAGAVTRGRDCDDANAAIHPTAAEIPFDSIDQDCSGADAGTIVTASGSGGDIYDFSTTLGRASVASCGSVQNIDVTVSITHSFIGDLEVVLFDPGNGGVLLHNFSGGGASGLSGTYSSRGVGSLSPAQSLSAFTGRNGSGTWTLQVYDGAFFDDGSLNSWSLTLYCL